MGIRIECDNCNMDLDNGADVYCDKCITVLEDEITGLKKEIDDLNAEIATMEKK